MTYNPEYFNFKSKKLIPIDEFIDTVLYKPNVGYYTKKSLSEVEVICYAPTISNLFSEIITIWVVSLGKTWKAKNFNL